MSGRIIPAANQTRDETSRLVLIPKVVHDHHHLDGNTDDQGGSYENPCWQMKGGQHSAPDFAMLNSRKGECRRAPDSGDPEKYERYLIDRLHQMSQLASLTMKSPLSVRRV